jgi:hypothetical protein
LEKLNKKFEQTKMLKEKSEKNLGKKSSAK